MPSLIPEYEYDIFISYRQKDNKGDMWVSEFVEALKTELESTFKEEISVYFDINPHDGLLETHDVDESLKEKLKCLIFMPIISRTYCDPKSFAWEHEFKAFVEQSSEDEFGLKVKLPNGNVASRVLPIIIYDLDKQDIKLFESVSGSVLRGVEFIYKEPGVNRPLRSNEEKPHENLNNTVYRNQVNKVGNTIKDVLNSLTVGDPSVDDIIKEPTSVENEIIAKKPVKKKPREIPSVSFLHRLKNLTAFSQKTWHIIVLVLLIVCVGAIWLGVKNEPDVTPKPIIKYDIACDAPLAFTLRKSLAISHNGEYLVYVTSQGLNLKIFNSDAPAIPIPETTGTRYPIFSHDDSWIAFELNTGNKLMKMPLTGGNKISICNLEGGTNGMNWYKNEIIFAVRSSIYRVPDTGGIPELLYPLNKSENDPTIWNPQLLPDEKTLLFSQLSENGSWSILSWRLGSKESASVLVEQGRDGRYLKSGHIVYTLNNRLYFSEFNSRSNRIVPEPQIIATNPVYETLNTGVSQYDFSENGILVYYENLGTNQQNLVWLEESGAITPITKDAKNYSWTPISSDAQNIAAAVLTENGWNIEIVNTKTGNSRLFAENAWYPVWSADNSLVYYVSTITGNQVFQEPLDLSKNPELLFEIDSASYLGILPLSTDGRYLPFKVSFSTVDFELGYYDMANNKIEILEHYNTDGSDDHPSISPDEKWLAYDSNYDGQAAIYVAPFPGPGQPTRVTSPRPTNDISLPIWSSDMTALYYVTRYPNDELWRINIIQTSENNFEFEPAQPIFNGGNAFFSHRLEIHPSGDRFLITQKEVAEGQEAIEPRIKVIVNWEQELEDN